MLTINKTFVPFIIAALLAAPIHAKETTEAKNIDFATAVDMSGYLELRYESICKLGDQGEGIIEGLLAFDEARQEWVNSKPFPLPDGRRVPANMTKEIFTEEGAQAQSVRVEVNMPEGVIWHEMPLGKIEVGVIDRNETDDYNWRKFTVDMPLKDAQSALAAIGEEMPVEPLYRVITSADRCDGAAYVESAGGKTILHCGWGC